MKAIINKIVQFSGDVTNIWFIEPAKRTIISIMPEVKPYLKKVAEIKSTRLSIFFPKTVALPKEIAAIKEKRAAMVVLDPAWKSGSLKPKARK